ncbi:hypothetical protein VNO77_33132 [Canavalia gladiata]|uniref:25S rRNA (uridine-N(3))-methyltransferase BMT5-like domain-containing protein n=1 Tax=Canavalia gladiata TaxID=3824 RepID=A0AAN9KB61_CANGL
MITHYRSYHKILLVGEGDFSFSLCLARAFGTAMNMVATSLDSRESLGTKYAKAITNLTELVGLGCTIVHEVDVHTMAQHSLLKFRSFDRIIFNFPHAGFFLGENNELQIELHKKLVRGFLSSAQFMLSLLGKIHITHKTSHPFSKWNIKELAEHESLMLVGEVEFDKDVYPGYCNKRGDGNRCDQTFPVGKCSTFMFANLLN